MSGGSTTILAERHRGGTRPPRLEIEEWRREHGIVAGITGADDEFDLALWGSRPGIDTMSAWRSFQESFGPEFGQFVVGHQQHGIIVDLDINWVDNMHAHFKFAYVYLFQRQNVIPATKFLIQKKPQSFDRIIRTIVRKYKRKVYLNPFIYFTTVKNPRYYVIGIIW